ncbi:ATP-binding protein [Geomonas nitrogeniifigens]|uniref:AlbA family DNA-binding domain-containing protein n=1 Tax=Geomonas diazotrophica TaxID=2843197 RepID=UPI001C2C5ECE|nr:ATP-binding protein [Geomonas nitrogeniifigens]QXE87415.1 ATP-binding protein [Geomonas nitrogeniifigens]
MEAPSTKLLAAISQALSSGIEVTLLQLVELLEYDGFVLDQLEKVKKFLEDWGLQLNPPITTGDFTSPRIMRNKNKSSYNKESFKEDIKNGESSKIEFKSSLLYDHHRAKSQPQSELKDLRSSKVVYSALKAVGGFLNSGGGVLFVGLDDDAVVLGLHFDCAILGSEKFDPDLWELELRNQVTGKFKNGVLLNDYLDVTFLDYEGAFVARIQVQARKSLSFLKGEKGLQLFRRQGNRTIDVSIDEMEEFLDSRKQQIQP